MRKRRAQSVGHSLRLLGEQPLAPTLFRRFANLGRFVAPYAVVSLAEARNLAFANRQRAWAGGDPLAEKRHGQGVPTVEEAAAAVLEQ